MPTIESVDWQGELTRGLEAHSVPGAVLLISDGQQTVTVAAGITNANTGIPTTTETLFQIGSVTKVWTTTLVQMLCDEGLMSLDDPVSRFIPEFAAAAGGAHGLAAVTIRHLLNHTSGLEGDMFSVTGRGDEVLQTLTESVCKEPLIFQPGEWMSYSNEAFIVAGRVLEVVSGQTFDDLLQTRIVEPLGLTHTETLPENVLLHSAAVGHVHAPGQPAQATDEWQLPRCVGPAGLISTTAEDLHAFVLMHLRDGQDPSGKHILSKERAIEMRTPQAMFPRHIAEMPGEGFGNGWKVSPLGDTVRFGHNGGTIGQAAVCDVFPTQGAVFILLTNTNGGTAFGLARDLQTKAYPLIAGVQNVPPNTPTSTTIDPEPDYPSPGRYARDGVTIDLTVDDGVWSIVKRDYGVDSVPSEAIMHLETGPGGSLWWQFPGAYDKLPILPATLPDGSQGLQFLLRYYPRQAAD